MVISALLFGGRAITLSYSVYYLLPETEALSLLILISFFSCSLFGTSSPRFFFLFSFFWHFTFSCYFCCFSMSFSFFRPSFLFLFYSLFKFFVFFGSFEPLKEETLYRKKDLTLSQKDLIYQSPLFPLPRKSTNSRKEQKTK